MKQVAGREYAFVSATAWNRRSFIVVFREAIQRLLNTEAIARSVAVMMHRTEPPAVMEHPSV